MNTNIEFPVLRFSRGHLGVLRDPTELTFCAEKVLKNGFFDDYSLVDALCRCFTLVAIRKIRYKPPFWGWRLMYSRLIEVEMEFGEPQAISMQEITRLVVEAIMRQRDFWEAAWDVDDLVSRVRSAHSVPELVDLLDQ